LQVRDIKEAVCRVAVDYEQERLDNELDTVVEKYLLPDETEILLDAECYRAPEVLFDPSMMGSPAPGLSQLIYDTVMGCPIETRRDLFENIVLVGGSVAMPGLAERIDADLTLLTPPTIEVGVAASEPGESPDELVWRGAASFAASAQFSEGLLTRALYEEYGAGIVHSKFYFDDRSHFPHSLDLPLAPSGR